MDSNRIPTSSYYYPRKATDNFLRLCRLITELCRDLLRVVLCHYIRPPDLRTELDNNKTRLIRILNAKAKKQIYPATGNPTLAVKDFDISTLYILLRNICNLPQHQNGRGNEPTRGDNSIAACIERIRCQRNEYVHSTGTVEDTTFQNSWSELPLLKLRGSWLMEIYFKNLLSFCLTAIFVLFNEEWHKWKTKVYKVGTYMYLHNERKKIVNIT